MDGNSLPERKEAHDGRHDRHGASLLPWLAYPGHLRVPGSGEHVRGALVRGAAGQGERATPGAPAVAAASGDAKALALKAARKYIDSILVD